MKDYSELQRAAEAALKAEKSGVCVSRFGDAWASFDEACKPEIILELIAARANLAVMLEKFFGFVEAAPVSSGVCCCGDSTSQPNHGDHGAVDQWDHSISVWSKEIHAAISGESHGTNNGDQP